MLELTQNDVQLGKSAATKQEAIQEIANDLVAKGLVVEGYSSGMLARENQNSTYLGNGIAIPHGTTDTRHLVTQTGVQIHHFANGVDWGNGNTVYLAIGIAAKSDEHLGILKQLTHVLSADSVEEALKAAASAEQILVVLNGTNQKGLLFDESTITLNFPTADLVSMSAVCAGKLKTADAVGQGFVSSLVGQSPVCLGQGLWLNASSESVKQTAISFLSVERAFEVDGKAVKGLIAVAANSAEHTYIMKNISELAFDGKIAEVFASSPEAVVKAFSEVRQGGLSQIFKIKNAHGLHARPGAMLVSVAKKFDSQIWVSNLNGDGKQVNAKSLMKVIALGVKQGHELEFTADGSDAQVAIDAIGQAIEAGLGEG
ncbi:bifunctional PTS system fructose-specific transporter subunit IIA/HPr protein [Grimontia sp. AD028]|uniref:fused PTS fructose transporter subunit IIA/HPr protein n=1 Tax=Grimontia sp. AD028 TaxID=1581149 RepID=UPI00061AC815|nr:fused PTS fructose transporter subunit IIA/HPr protein [Grimontia sp. AD028]KKD58221.1 bifunctional PTS system fructose-specific transporter subunit IIA/HPr protein [Grimontia sp. AD028]